MMDTIKNLDIHEFLAVLGKKAITNACQGFSNCQSKHSKPSDIVFVEDTDLCTESGCAYREKAGVSQGGGRWNTSSLYGLETGNKGSFHVQKDSLTTRNRFGCGEVEKEAQTIGWEGSSPIDTNSGWGEQNGPADGWGKETQETSNDGWGEGNTESTGTCKQKTHMNASDDTGWGEEQETVRKSAGNHTGWGFDKKEISEAWRQGINSVNDMGQAKEQEKESGKARNCNDWESSEQSRGKGSTSNVLKLNNGWGKQRDEDSVSKTNAFSPGDRWNESPQGQGFARGRQVSKIQQLKSSWRGEKSLSSKYKVGSAGEGTRNDWGSLESKSAACGWEEHEVPIPADLESVAKSEIKSGWETSMNEKKDSGWGDERQVDRELEVKKKRPISSGCIVDPEMDTIGDARERDSSQQMADGSLESKKISSGWERSEDKGSYDRWEEDKIAPIGLETCKQIEDGTRNGSGDSIIQSNHGGWEGSKGSAEALESRNKLSVPDGINELDKTGNTGNDGWCAENKTAVTGWGTCIQDDEGAKDEWGGSSNKENISMWSQVKGIADGWGNSKGVSASIDTNKKNLHDNVAHIEQEMSMLGEGHDKWDSKKSLAGGRGSILQQESDDGWGEDKDCSGKLGKAMALSVSSGLEWNKESSLKGWGCNKTEKYEDSSLSQRKESDDWGKHDQTHHTSTGTGSTSLKTNGHWRNENRNASGWRGEWRAGSDRWGTGSHSPKTNAGWGKEKHAAAAGGQGEWKPASGTWGQGNRKCTPGERGRKKSFDTGRWQRNASKEGAVARGGWGQDNNSSWDQKRESITNGWGQRSRGCTAGKLGNGMHVKTGFGQTVEAEEWKERNADGDEQEGAEGKSNDGWEEKGAAGHDKWESSGHKEVDTCWGERSMLNTYRLERESSQGEGTQATQFSSGWGDERGASFAETRSVDDVAYTGWRNDKERDALDKTNEPEKAKEDSNGGWEQSRSQNAAVRCEGNNKDGWITHELKGGDSSWGQGRQSSEGQCRERTEGTSGGGWGKSTNEVARAQQENKGTAWKTNSNWNCGTEERNAGWRKSMTAGATSAECGESKNQVSNDGWGEVLQEHNSSRGWGSSEGTIANEDSAWNNHGAWKSGSQERNTGWAASMTIGATSAVCGERKHQQNSDGWGEFSVDNSHSGWGLSQNEAERTHSTLVDRLGGQNARAVDDTSGSNDGAEKGSGCEAIADGWNSQNRLLMNSRDDVSRWSKSLAADNRRSGTFGPSGSNTVPLGKRKGSEANDWKPSFKEGTPSHLSYERSQQDQRPWVNKRFNNGYGSQPRKDFRSQSPQNYNRRPRALKSLLSLPEYSDIDELYKTTSKILHHSGYQAGDRLNSDDENFVLEKVLAHHREKDAKLGCGLDHIMIDSHADHQVNCFWIVRKDESKTDFSYWKCLENLFEVKYGDVVKEAQEEESDAPASAPHESSQVKEATRDLETMENVVTEEESTSKEKDAGW